MTVVKKAIHPGEVLKEEYLRPLGISANALARAIHVTPARVNDIVLCRRGVTPDTALRLARYFGGDAQQWLNLQLVYDLRLTEQSVLETISTTIVPFKRGLSTNQRVA